ncbi:MAG TPA: hypothetical protein VGP79_02920 [Bryobacteraceae bacterium]|nr:hypothetical protein [Bryobacteraceae bacterium]
MLLVAPLFGQNRVITTIAGAEWLFPGDGRPATQAALGGPTSLDIATDRNGNYYIADDDNAIIVKVGPDGIANVVAGNGLLGLSGNNGLAVNASLGQPISVAVDASGNIYIGEYSGLILKVTSDGIIRTFAGTGVNGFSGDNGPALQAQIGQVYGMVFDSAGNLYFSELDNHRIRRITPGGIITTVAGTGVAGFSGDGGPATAAKLDQPSRLAIDGNNALYIVDLNSHLVRKIVNGTITTIAGNGTGQGEDIPAATAALAPLAVTVGPTGIVYITDFLTSGIRRIDTNGRIRTIAGSAGSGFSGDGGPALSAKFNFTLYPSLAIDSTGALLVGDNQNGRVRRITADQRVATVAGNGLYRFSGNGGPATSASLNFPLGIATDSAGNIYIAETLQMRVRKITPDGTISVVAGNGIQGYTGDGGPAVNASLSYPSSVALDAQGNLYVADTVNSVIRKIDTRGIISTFAGTGFTDYNGEGLAPTSTNLSGPGAIAFTPSGEMLISDTGNHLLRLVLATGDKVFTFAGDLTAGFGGDGTSYLNSLSTLNKPVGLAFFNGATYFCDSLNHRVRKITAGTFVISTVAGNGKQGFSGDGGQATLASLDRPEGVKFDSAGNMYIAERGNGLVRKVAPNGIITTFAGSPDATSFADGVAANTTFLGPVTDVAIDPAGNVLIVGAPSHRIRSVLVNPPTFQVSGNTLAFTAPAGSVAIDQTITVSGSIPGIPFNVSLSNSPWLSVTPTSGIMPATLRITSNPAALGAGTQTGTVTISAANTTPTSIPISVRLTTTAAGQPSLAVKPTSMVFPFVQNAAAATRPLTVLNQGGGSINFNLATSTSSGGSWLRVSATSGTVAAFASTNINVTADPARLSVGVYSGSITLTSTNPAQSVTFAVTMTISAVQQTILIPQTGLTFFAVQGGGQTLPQFFNILNTGAGQMPFTVRASTASGGNWLAANPSNGTSDVNSPIVPAIRVDVNPGTLGPGIYSGTVQVTAPGADNNPQFVSIFLNVLPPGSRVGPLVQPSGIIFSAVTGAGDPGSQNVTVQSLSTTPVTFRAACVTEGGNWCKAVPLEGTVTPTQPLRIVVQPQVSGLAPNVYRGTLTISFSDGTSRSVALLLVVLPSGAVVTSSEIRGATSNCAPKKLAPTFAGILGGAPAAVGFPGQVLVKVVDDCANPMTSGTVTVNFDNGDLPLSLTSLKDGGWATTWAPSHPATTVTLTASAEIPELKLTGSISAQAGFVTADAPPQVGTGAILNAASNALDSPVAPGSLISIYGAKMTQGTEQFSTVPLPTTLATSSVLIAGSQAGLTFASEGQINAQLPYETAVNTTQQALVLRGNNFSAPMPFTVAAAAPGIFLQSGAQGHIYVANASGQTLANSANPAKAGDTLVIYCTGLGRTDPPVPSGQATPFALFSSVEKVTASIGGVAADVLFSGLTPGFVGLYQVNATVKAGTPTGNAVALILTAAGQSSKPAMMAVR